MRSLQTSRFLRWVLFADAATCIVTGLLMMFASEPLERLLGLPSAMFRYAGISLLPFAAFLIYLATRDDLSERVLWAVIILNGLWTVDSLLLLATGWVAPTDLGYAFVTAQAVAVALFAGLEYAGMKRSAAATA